LGIIGLALEGWEHVAARIERADGPIAWCWLATPRQDGSWQPALLTVRGATHATSAIYRYSNRVILSCEQLAPVVAAERFRTGRLYGDLNLAAEHLAVTPSASTSLPMWITTERDYAYYMAPPSEWPTFHWTAPLPSDGLPLPGMTDALYGTADSPYFPSLRVALASLAYGLPLSQVNTNFNPQVFVRLPDLRARVTATATEEGVIAVTVAEGKAGGCADCLLHAIWRRGSDDVDWERHDTKIETPQRVVVNTRGIPADFWVLLTDGIGTAIDRAGWSSDTGLRPEASGPLSARVERWSSEGEHDQLEYKEKLVDTDTKLSFAETIAAFANGTGGVILVGVTDRGEIVGFDPPKFSDMVTNIIRDRVDDPVTPTIERADVAGKPVWVISVDRQPAESKPFRCNDKVMVRVNGTTRAAKTAEIRWISNTTQPQSRSPF
jgi:hypothetical protein